MPMVRATGGESTARREAARIERGEVRGVGVGAADDRRPTRWSRRSTAPVSRAAYAVAPAGSTASRSSRHRVRRAAAMSSSLTSTDVGVPGRREAQQPHLGGAERVRGDPAHRGGTGSAGSERVVQRRAQLRLHGDHPGAGAGVPRGDPTDQPAAAHGHDDDVEVGGLLRQLPGDGPLPGQGQRARRRHGRPGPRPRRRATRWPPAPRRSRRLPGAPWRPRSRIAGHLHRRGDLRHEDVGAGCPGWRRRGRRPVRGCHRSRPPAASAATAGRARC